MSEWWTWKVVYRLACFRAKIRAWYDWLTVRPLSGMEWADMANNHPKMYRHYCLGIISETEAATLYRQSRMLAA